MQTQHFRDESTVPMATGFYECTYFEKYRMDYCDNNHSERHMHKRPRTPPSMPPKRSRTRSRSRSLKRRHRSPPMVHYHDYRSYDHRHIDSYDDRHSSHSRAQSRPQESRCIGIFGLSGRTTEADIRRIFSKFGYIENVVLIMDNHTRRSRGYCFVYFDSLKSAIRAVESSANLRIDSRYVRVDYSMTTRPRSPGYLDRPKDGYGVDHSRHRSQRNGRGHSPSSPRRHHR